MPNNECVDVIDEETPETAVPEVEVIGDEAVIRLKMPEGLTEERRVKLPETTWG